MAPDNDRRIPVQFSKSARLLVGTFATSLSSLIFCLALQGCAHLHKVEITHQFDNLVVMHTTRRLHGMAEIGRAEICKKFYDEYTDVFDLVFIVSNVPTPLQDFDKIGFFGLTKVVRNSIEGVGAEVFDDGADFGSNETLKGIMYLPSRSLFIEGPTLHEIMHLWVRDKEIIPSAIQQHWGFSDVHGQLGGFDRSKLTLLGKDYYSAGDFTPFANFGNSVPYSPLELYLGGWVPATEVPDIWVLEDGRWVEENGTIKTDANGNRIFTGNNISYWSIEKIIARLGERIPNYKNSKKIFRGVVILVGNKKHPVSTSDIELLRKHVELFSRTESIRAVEGFEEHYNFWEATRGKAKLSTATLDRTLRLTRNSLREHDSSLMEPNATTSHVDLTN